MGLTPAEGEGRDRVESDKAFLFHHPAENNGAARHCTGVLYSHHEKVSQEQNNRQWLILALNYGINNACCSMESNGASLTRPHQQFLQADVSV